MLQVVLPYFRASLSLGGKKRAAFSAHYLQGKGQAVPDVVLIIFQLFYLLLQIQPLFVSLLQDLLPLFLELIL